MVMQIDTLTGQYMCEGCGSEFGSEADLRKHQSDCAGMPQAQTYTCSRCGAAFATEDNLRDHEHTHQGVQL